MTQHEEDVKAVRSGLESQDEIFQYQNELGRILDRLAKYERALNQIACWDQGKEVMGAFDDPGTARIAREALADK